MPNRLIRDEMLESESILSLSVEARWFYVTILLCADDVGLFEATSFKLARRADVDRDRGEGLIQELVDSGLIRLYESAGKRYGFVPKFRQRLQIKRLKCPTPPSEIIGDDEDALSKINNLGIKTTVGQPCSTVGQPCSTVGQPSEPEPEPEPEPEKNKYTPIPPRGAIGLESWLEALKASGQKPIPEDDPVFAYAEQVGLPHDFLRLAWLEFRARYSDGSKRYKDWRSVFRKAVRGNWFRLWYSAEGNFNLTTVGIQAQRAHQRAA